MAQFIVLTEEQKKIARQLGLGESQLWAEMSLEALRLEEQSKPLKLSEAERVRLSLGISPEDWERYR